jgi:hypothetical protein
VQVGKLYLIALTVVVLVLAPTLPLFAQEHLGGEYVAWGRPCPAVIPASNPAACFCDPKPSLVGAISFDILILTRSSADKIDVLFANDVSNPVLNVRDVGFDATVGFRTNVLLTSECGCDLIFSYMGLHDLAERGHRADPGIFYRFYGGGPLDPANAYYVDYESHLDNVELNVRTRQWGRFAPLVGMRITQLEEVFNIIDAESTSTTTGVFSETENEMYGVQFGTEFLFCELGRTRLEGKVRGCVYFNDMAITAEAADASGSPLNLDRDYWHTSFGGDAQLVWTYQWCRNFAIRVAYEALWLEGVALAPDQSDNFRLSTGEGSLDLGTAFYQGGYIGFDISW